MKHLTIILALLWCASALAQPVNRIKLRQLQAAPDTTSNYRILASKDTSEWVLVGVSSITNVPDTSGLAPNIGDMFVNATADTLGVHNGTQWLLFYGGSGGGAGDNLGDHTATTTLDLAGNNLQTNGGIILGGTGTGSDLILQSTSGVGGATSEILFQVGNNGGTEAMRIRGNGNVGINQSSPAQTLHVSGTARITGSDGTPTGLMGRDADGDVGAVSLGNGLTLTTGTLTANDTVTTLIQDSILIYSIAGTEVGRDTVRTPAGVTGSGTTNYLPKWTSSTALGNSVIRDDGTQIGIGIAPSSLAKVSIDADMGSAYSGLRISETGGTGYFTVSNATNGVASFIPSFQAYSNSSIGVYYISRIGTDNSTWTGMIFDARRNVDFALSNAAIAKFATLNVVKMSIMSNGRVGIGPSNPSYTLDISGTDGARIPVGTTAQRPTGADGVIRYNSTLTAFEGYGSSAWNSILTTQAATGKLTAGSVAFGASTGISEDNSNLFWNDTDNRLGIGTNAPDVSLDFTGKTDGVDLPAGTTAQRPTSDQGTIRFNTDLKTLEVASASTWFQTKLAGTDRALGDDTSANYGSADAGGIIQISDATNNSTIITYTLPATPEDKLEITCECKAGSVIDGDDGCRIAGNGNNIQGSANYDFAAANTTVTIRYSSVLGEWKIIY